MSRVVRKKRRSNDCKGRGAKLDGELENLLAAAKTAGDALRHGLLEHIALLQNLFEGAGFDWDKLAPDQQRLLEDNIADLGYHVEGDLSRTTLRADFERMLQLLPNKVRITIERDILEFRLEMLDREEQDLAEEAAEATAPVGRLLN